MTIRAAKRSDIRAIARIMNYPPEPPMAVLLGADRASRLGEWLVLNGVVLSIEHSFVAEAGGRVVGVIECGTKTGGDVTAFGGMQLLPRALLIAGSKIPRAIAGLRAQGRVQFEPQPGAFVVAQLYVDGEMRNRGIGGKLLDHAESLARKSDASRMIIETGIANPARHLYERHGFELLATKTDAGYERLSGSPGRVMLFKEIA